MVRNIQSLSAFVHSRCPSFLVSLLSRLLKNSTFTALLKGLLALGVLGYLVYAIEPDRLLAAAREAEPLWIAAAVALLPLNVFLEGVVWRQVLRLVAPQLSWRMLYEALLCGFSLGLFTPMRVGEFTGRAFYLPRTDRWTTSATVFVQRLLDMTVSVGVGFLALLYALSTDVLEPSPAWWGVAAFGGGTTLTLTALMLHPGLVVKGLSRFVSSRKVLGRLVFLRRLRLGRMAKALALSFVRYAVYTLQFVFLAFAFGAAGLWAIYLGVTLTFFAKFLIPSITAMDLGIREGAAVFFFGQLGLGGAAAFNASFLLFFTNLILPAAVGLPFVLRLRLKSAPSGQPEGAPDEAAHVSTPA